MKAQTDWEYVKTAAALSSQHVKSRVVEVEKPQSIQQKSMHRKERDMSRSIQQKTENRNASET